MNNDYKDFLLRLKEERVRCGLTQRQLCGHAKTGQSSFSKAETGCLRFTCAKLKCFCAAGMDIFYAFTGNKAADCLGFLEPSTIAPEELLWLLHVISIHAAARVQSRAFSRASSDMRFRASMEQILKQLEYFRYLSESTIANQNILYCLRNYYGYTQGKMADLLGIDVKKLRKLEKGRQLPDSEIIWKMYQQFHVSPAFILEDPVGMRHELNYVLGLLDKESRETMLHILESCHKLVWM